MHLLSLVLGHITRALSAISWPSLAVLWPSADEVVSRKLAPLPLSFLPLDHILALEPCPRRSSLIITNTQQWIPCPYLQASSVS